METFRFQPNSQPTCPLRPVIPNNTCSSRFTAAAGTKLAGASSSSTVIIFLDDRVLQPYWPSSLTRYCWIRVSPIVQYSPLLRPKGAGPCLSPSVADHPLRPAKDLGLGEPLSHQLPNLTQAHLTAINLCLFEAIRYFIPNC